MVSYPLIFQTFAGTFEDNSDDFDTQDNGDGQVYLKPLNTDWLEDGQLFNISVCSTEWTISLKVFANTHNFPPENLTFVRIISNLTGNSNR